MTSTSGSASHGPAPSHDWQRRHEVARDSFLPWLESVVALEGRCILEYGCGAGPVSAAFAPSAGRYIGLDIDPQAIAAGQEHLAARDLHPELRAAEPHELPGVVDGYRGEVDVFLCYAVLEHMDVPERLELLSLAREVVRPNGVIVVIETPNRLALWDHHTAQLPFFNQLSEDLALRYAGRSPREEYVAALEAGAASGPEVEQEAFTRWGRGMSFHEFELVFGPLDRHVLATGWDPLLAGERDVHREELALDRQLARVRPDVPAAFSRYWLDLIMAPQPLDSAPTGLVRPWPMSTTGAPGVAYTQSETLALTGPDAVLRVDLPNPSPRLVVSLEQVEGCRVRQLPYGRDVAPEPLRITPWTTQVDAVFAEPAAAYEIRLPAPGTVTSVLYAS